MKVAVIGMLAPAATVKRLAEELVLGLIVDVVFGNTRPKSISPAPSVPAEHVMVTDGTTKAVTAKLPVIELWALAWFVASKRRRLSQMAKPSFFPVTLFMPLTTGASSSAISTLRSRRMCRSSYRVSYPAPGCSCHLQHRHSNFHRWRESGRLKIHQKTH